MPINFTTFKHVSYIFLYFLNTCHICLKIYYKIKNMWSIIFLNEIDISKLYHIFAFNFLDFGLLANLLCFAMKCHPLFFQMLCINALEYLAILITYYFSGERGLYQKLLQGKLPDSFGCNKFIGSTLTSYSFSIYYIFLIYINKSLGINHNFYK